MENETYKELQKKIDSIEAELSKAKLELESSKKDDLKEEINTLIDRIQSCYPELKFLTKSTEQLENVRNILIRLLDNNDANDYSLVKSFFSKLKEEVGIIETKISELKQGINSFDMTIKVILNENEINGRNIQKTEEDNID